MTYHDPEHIRMALFDLAAGDLTPAEAAAVRRAIAEDPGLEAEYDELVVLAKHLHAYGDRLVAELPKVDVAEAVAARIAAGTSEENGPIPFRAPRKGARPFWWLTAAAAAAVALMALWFAMPEPAPPPGVTQGPVEEHGLELAQDLPAPAKAPEREQPPGMPEAPFDVAEAPAIDPAAPSVDAILEHRRAAVESEESRMVLARWAALSPDKARAVLTDPAAPDRAVVGAALALSNEEAVPFLAGAVDRNPDDPFLNLQLAKAGGAAYSPEDDPDNALAWYLYARHLLRAEPPDVDGALEALAKAGPYERAHAYALETALYHEQALIASGLPPDSARFLTAFTTGTDEYDALLELGLDLLDYGQYFQELGEVSTAEVIIEAVQRFGEQLDQGAFFSHERLAGLEIQDAALQVLAMYDGERMQSLTRDMGAVAAGFTGLVAFINNMNGFFSDTLAPDMWRTVADIILNQGDLQLFNSLARP
jgi:tetratricopeptide (TPR) repeat protein